MAKCSSAQKSFKGGREWGRAGGVVVFLYRYNNGVGWVYVWVWVYVCSNTAAVLSTHARKTHIRPLLV